MEDEFICVDILRDCVGPRADDLPSPAAFYGVYMFLHVEYLDRSYYYSHNGIGQFAFLIQDIHFVEII